MSPAKIIGYAVTAIYPLFVFLSLAVFRLPVRLIGLAVLLLAVSFFFAKKREKPLVPLVMCALALLVIFTRREAVLRVYPVAVNAVMLGTFALSLRKGGGIVFDFAQLGDKSVRWSASQGAIQRYCRKVTCVWCAFFACNAAAALCTVFYGDTGLWTLYNGLLAYILAGCLFAAEFAVRTRTQKLLARNVPLTEMRAGSRESDRIVCFSGNFSKGKFKFWRDYLAETAALRDFIDKKAKSGKSGAERVVLHAEDFWHFIVGFTAALQCGKDVYVSSNILSDFVKSLDDGRTLFLSETPCEAGRESGLSGCIPDILKDAGQTKSGGGTQDTELPAISEDARVFLFTSGSTGQPKEVPHTISELEDDNDSIGELWRGDFQKRLLVSSVNPHHAFGIVFAMLKPFVHGVPFRRERLIQPDEFTQLGSEKYVFITTPSYLRTSSRDPAVPEAMETLGGIRIVTAGGVLRQEEAEAAEAAFRAYPLEIYGSTETGAVGWRINRGGESEWWTPTRGVGVSLGEDGCLVFSGKAIHGDAFQSSDMAELRADGKYKLLGRKDSVVKIAEKRVSLIEVANRIMQTGLAKDAAVFAMSGERRQYLAAVVALSEEGEETLAGMTHASKMKCFRAKLAGQLESVTIPRRWRFVRELPYNSMGKLQKQEALALFDKEIEN